MAPIIGNKIGTINNSMSTRTEIENRLQEALGEAEPNSASAQHSYYPTSHEDYGLSSAMHLLVRHGVEAAHHSSETRDDRIAALQAQIDSGTYVVNSTALAMKMLGIEQAEISPEGRE